MFNSMEDVYEELEACYDEIMEKNISAIGDTLYTASNSAVYISEIPVCRVLEVNEAKNKDPFKNVTVELLTDLRTINFGVVISSDIKFE